MVSNVYQARKRQALALMSARKANCQCRCQPFHQPRRSQRRCIQNSGVCTPIIQVTFTSVIIRTWRGAIKTSET